MLSKERIEQEIKHSKETIEKLEQIQKDSISGIEINDLIILMFEAELEKL